MASIRTAIELNDKFTAPMMSIINAADMGVTAMNNIREAMNNTVNASSLNNVQAEINQTNAAAQVLNNTLQNMSSPSFDLSNQPVINVSDVEVPVTPVVTEEPVINVSDVEIPVTPVVTEEPVINVNSVEVPVTPVVTEEPVINVNDVEVPVAPVVTEEPVINVDSVEVSVTPVVTEEPVINVNSVEVPVTPVVTEEPVINVNGVEVPVTPIVTEEPVINVSDLEVPVTPVVTEEPVINVSDLEVPVTPVVTEEPVINVNSVEVPVTPVVTEEPVINVDGVEVPVTPVVTEEPAINVNSVEVPVTPVVAEEPVINVSSVEVPVTPVVTEEPVINVNGVEVPVTPVVTEEPVINVNGVEVPVTPIVTEEPVINVSSVEVPVTPIVTEEPVINVDSVEVPVTPVVTEEPAINVDSLEVPVNVSVGGMSESEQQIAEITNRLNSVTQMQAAIRDVAASVYILPNETASDINTINREIVRMQHALEFLRTNPFDLDSSIAELQIRSISESLDELTERQQRINEYMGNIPSQTVELNVETTVPDPLVEPQPPVEVPVVWRSDNFEIFTGTGIERFQQEIQSANSMLNTLNQNQARIAQTAAGTNLFPQNMAADLNNMQNRMQAISRQIAAIENNPLDIGSAEANAQLEQLRSQLNQAVTEQEILNDAVARMDVQSANDAYLRLSGTIGSTERYIRDNISGQKDFNNAVSKGTSEASQLMNTIKKAAAAYLSIQGVTSVMNISDDIVQTTARLDLIVDDGGSVEELQNKIYASAQNARGSYQATADAVSKLGMQASQAFTSNDELIAFTELLNKQFVNAGTSVQGVDSVMLQLTQSMAAGKLQGEELNAVLDNAAPIVQNIQRYMEEVQGIDASNIKELASEGQITADIVKNSMFYAADDINSKFESMPMTWGQVWQSIQNTALMAFQPVLQMINDMANSGGLQKMQQYMTSIFGTLANAALSVISVIGMIGNFVMENWGTIETVISLIISGLEIVIGILINIADLAISIAQAIIDNWSMISPVIYGIATALMVYYGVQLAVNTINAISKGIHIAMAIAQMIHAAATGALTAATAAEIAAQNGLNAALYACPIVWIIVLIIGLVALFYAAVAAVNKFAGTSVSATGIICGAFMVAIAYIGNRIVSLINLIIDGFARSWNFIAAFANFFGNVFDDPIGSIARLFNDLVDNILSLLESLASAIDTIFGSNLAGAVSGWRDSLDGWVDEKFGQGEEIMAKINAEDYHLDRFEYKTAWDKGYDFGKGIEDKITNFDPSNLFDANVPNPEDYGTYSNNSYSSIEPDTGLGGIGNGVDDIAGNTESIADSMDITDEDLKYLRDIAEQETLNRFTTAEIKIEQNNNNNISSDMDIDGVVTGLTDAVNEAVNIIAEGVHA